MKKITLIGLLTAAAFATDYSSMTLTELQNMRGSVPEADRAAFQNAMQSKMQSLSPEERQTAAQSMRKSQSGAMDGSGSQMRKGGGMGHGRGMGR